MYIGTVSTVNESKINRLLQSIPVGTVILSSWLRDHGYSFDLQKRYRKSSWLVSIGTGAMKRKGDYVDYKGAIFALQKQAKLTTHPGGKTALGLLGKAHYLELSDKSVTLFAAQYEALPTWFRNYPWQYSILHYRTNILPPQLGLVELEQKNFTIQVSGPGRAIMECLYLVPKRQDLMECHEIMEGLNNLRPVVVQELLEQCTSVKVKRLFLFLAELSGHEWFKYLHIEKLDLGSGKRVIIQNGAYNSKYQITVHKELEEKYG